MRTALIIGGTPGFGGTAVRAFVAGAMQLEAAPLLEAAPQA